MQRVASFTTKNISDQNPLEWLPSVNLTSCITVKFLAWFIFCSKEETEEGTLNARAVAEVKEG